MKHRRIAFDTAIGPRLVGLTLYGLALLTSSMGFLLDSPALFMPSLFVGSAVLLAAIWHHFATAVAASRRSKDVVRTSSPSEIGLKRAS